MWIEDEPRLKTRVVVATTPLLLVPVEGREVNNRRECKHEFCVIGILLETEPTKPTITEHNMTYDGRMNEWKTSSYIGKFFLKVKYLINLKNKSN